MYEIVVWVLVMGIIGYFLGGLRGIPGSGALASVLLGPLGWIAIFISKDERLKCPDCKGAVPDGARKCMHCGSSLWVPAQRGSSTEGIDLKCPKCGEDGRVNSGKDEDQVECPACQHEFRIVEGRWASMRQKDHSAEQKWRKKLSGFRGSVSH